MVSFTFCVSVFIHSLFRVKLLSNCIKRLQNDQGLRRTVSLDIEIVRKDHHEFLEKINEIAKAECKCCGLIEDCTPEYIEEIRDAHCGQFVCGLCSEAVKERLSRVPKPSMEEAIHIHASVCQKFNTTTRINPKLSLAWAMRDIAKRKSQNRVSNSVSASKITRSSSCFPNIDFMR
ncbi:hypothetical protein ACHQM5_028706 [Ranunculus cassubicifolius]